jgi:hypothetical protein
LRRRVASRRAFALRDPFRDVVLVATHLYLRRVAIEDALATEVEAPLDYFMPFRRSTLNDYEAGLGEYVQPGSDDDESQGFYET